MKKQWKRPKSIKWNKTIFFKTKKMDKKKFLYLKIFFDYFNLYKKIPRFPNNNKKNDILMRNWMSFLINTFSKNCRFLNDKNRNFVF